MNGDINVCDNLMEGEMMKTKVLLLMVCAALLSGTGSVSAALPSVGSGTLYLHIDASDLSLSNGDPVISWTDSVPSTSYPKSGWSPHFVSHYANRLPAVPFGSQELGPNIDRVIVKLDAGLSPVSVDRWFRLENVDLQQGDDNLSPLRWLARGEAWQPVADLAEDL